VEYSNNDESPRAYIVLKPGQTATAEEIVRFMDGKVSAFKRITGGVRFLEVIPKNASGKIVRRTLREQAKEELKKDNPAAKL
jgi:acyl-coenzyme A synthetase/AMP-(fatty) acid ligase